MTKKELERKMEKVTKRQVAERNSLMKYVRNMGSTSFANVSWKNAIRHDVKRKDV